MALTYHTRYEKAINTETWDQGIANITTATRQELNGFLVHRMVIYEDRKYVSTVLWECIQEDFDQWSKEIWAIPEKYIIRDFRNFLVENGVFVPKSRNIGEEIQKVIDIEEEHQWSPEELDQQLSKGISPQWRRKLMDIPAPINPQVTHQATHQVIPQPQHQLSLQPQTRPQISSPKNNILTYTPTAQATAANPTTRY